MPSQIHLPLLDRVRIASPCPAKWEDMKGSDVERHCAQCNLSVFNLSNMPRDEAEALLQQKEADPSMRLCAGFFRRADGTIIMKDCPIGVRGARARMVKIAGRIAAVIGLLAFGGYATANTRSEPWRAWGWSMKLRDLQPFKAVSVWMRPPPPRTMFLGGMICLPQQPPELKGKPVEFGPRPEF